MGNIASEISIITILRGLLGIMSLIFISWLFSNNRKAIPWKMVGLGLLMQFILAICVLYVPFVRIIFEIVGKMFVKTLDFTKAGSEFLLGNLVDLNHSGYIFVFQILPTIVFFSALTSLLFYLGVIQKVVFGLAWIFTKALKISGAESLAVAGNIFLGQTESPLMIKAYIQKMNPSEILLVMIGGMATIAGGVMAAYIGFLGGDDVQQKIFFAKHLLAASVMAAPGAIVVSKILYPQTNEISSNIEISGNQMGSNILDSITNGASEGLKLAANVGAMLLAFISFIAMINYILNKIGDFTTLNDNIQELTNENYSKLNLQMILGYIFSPLMWLIGVCTEDITYVGRLLGEKIILTEFVGYISLSDLKTANVFTENKSIIISTYMLCGFANISSIGIQIGGIGALAPTQKSLLSALGFKALLGGTIASLLSATMVGMLIA